MPSPPLPARGRQLAARLGVAAAGRLPAGVRRAINTARGIETPRLVDALPGTRPVVVAPHPDDELIGAGGALVGHMRRGHRGAIVHLTSGERTAGLLDLPADQRGPHREAEAVEAARSVGLDPSEVVFLRLPDGGLDAASDDQVDALATALGARRPDLVYAPWPIDAHRDHTAAAALVAAALARLDAPPPTIALYEVWTPLAPTHLIDITESIDIKVDALGCYGSALAAVDYRHTARGLAAYRSAQGLRGRGYAEAFSVVSPGSLIELLAALDAAAPADDAAPDDPSAIDDPSSSDR
jgi:N-acetylglucosamine malate deacetylase 1